jgi:tRNA pseudouridine55 synthase
MSLPELGLNGLLLVNKPSGPTSYDVIRHVKRKFKGIKIGHSGTLDPLASGLMILLLGSATKSQAVLMNQDKIYLCRARLGTKTDTGDCTGKIIQESSVPSMDEVYFKSKLINFIGEIEQIPPMYFAIKKEGVPLYKLARKGKTIEREKRKVKIYSINLIEMIKASEFEIEVHCSSGTYVRTLVEDVGESLGTCATMTALQRISIGPYDVKKSVDLEWITRATEIQFKESLIPVVTL